MSYISRSSKSAGSSNLLNNSPYARPLTTNNPPNKSTIIWKDFLVKISSRKAMIEKLKSSALNPSTHQSSLKRLMMDLRQLTMSIIEDALEIEYRNILATPSGKNKKSRLPPISSYQAMEEKEDVYSLADMINDLDDIYNISSIRVLLPQEFPDKRNPFMLGKSVDELAYVVPPNPEIGNMDEEIKVLEILRYKRAANALLRAESQLVNKLPISLQETENLLSKINEDLNIEKLIRCVSVILDNDDVPYGEPPNMKSIADPLFSIEPHDLLTRINLYKGLYPVRPDIHVAVRQTLQQCNFEGYDDSVSNFLFEWISIVLNSSTDHRSFDNGSPLNPSFSRVPSVIENSVLRSGKYSYSMPNRAIRAKEQREFNDLTSEVSSKHDRGTHENIYVEKEPQQKRLLGSREGSLQQGSMDYNISSYQNSQISSNVNEDSNIISEMDEKKAKKKTNQMSQLSKVKLRHEVEKIMKDLGVIKKKEQDENGELDLLNSMRYELYKMQNELLRRNVLDPKYYKLVSIDSVNHAQKGLTVNEIGNEFSNLSNKNKLPAISPQKKQEKNILSSIKQFIVNRQKYSVEIIIEAESKKVSIQVFEINQNVNSKTAEEKSDDESSSIHSFSRLAEEKKLIIIILISKLIFNKITSFIVDDLIKAKGESKAKITQNLFDQVELVLNQAPIPLGKIYPVIDRTFLKKEVKQDGVLVELSITRDEECSGLIVHCIPLAGIFTVGSQVNAAGPVTIYLHDNELEILLLNQRGLFILSLEKWTSMEMVAQWLANRVEIKKIKALDFSDENENKGIQSVDDILNMTELGSSNQSTLTAQESAFHPHESQLIVEGIQKAKSNATYNGTKEFIMLDMKINRSVELSKALFSHWKSRNLPNISGIQVVLDVSQELEMLNIHIRIILPDPKKFKEMAKSKKHSEDLVDLSQYSDDENEEFGVDGPVEIHLSYKLTRQELIIFGSTAVVENKKTSLSIQKEYIETAHPESFTWNIFNRLKVHFNGSKSNPFNKDTPANDRNNWDIDFNRKLVREVKSVSNGVMILTASAIGGELLFESEPVDSTVYSNVMAKIKTIGPKYMNEEELYNLVASEGLSFELLKYSERRNLAYALLDKLKIIEENNLHRIESQSYPETKMLPIFQRFNTGEPDLELGSVEINYHFTLSDVRILIKHELDIEDLPIQFRFLYKGSSCSLKQEPFRRAWECQPKCIIVEKPSDTHEIAIETDDILQRRVKAPRQIKKEAGIPKLAKGQRRMIGRYTPIPIPTLCYTQEGSNYVYLLHDSRDFFNPGDIVRIGNILGRDYIINEQDANQLNTYPKCIKIDPEYDIIEEPDFNVPTMGNSPWPEKNNGKIYVPGSIVPVSILKTPERMGFNYEIPENRMDLLYNQDPINSDKPTDLFDSINQTDFTKSSNEADLALSHIGSFEHSDFAATKIKSKRKKKRIFQHCWIWKCVPSKEDKRPKWRQFYDDGFVHYRYEFSSSEEYFQHFRVKAYYNYLEVLCTDARCPSLSYHYQRVNEMDSISLEFLTEHAFDKLTDWSPQYKRGIERMKFLKLMREIKSFPDLKRPARIAQLDMYFQKEVKSENGIVQKYINYAGFCRLLQEIAVIRFPPPKKSKDQANAEENDNAAGDNQSVKSAEDDNSSVTESIGEASSFKGSEGASTMESSSLKSTKDDSSKLNRKKQISSSARRDRLNQLRKKDPNNQNNEVKSALSSVDPVHAANAYKKFIVDFVMTYPGWYDAVWKKAKLLAMEKEALPYCAATRIAAVFRGHYWTKMYKKYVKMHIQLQANIRRKLTYWRTQKLISMLQEDWCFRKRFRSASIIQSIIRRFLKRCWYFLVLEKIKQEEVMLQKAKRFRYRKIRQSERKAIVYKEAKRINGILAFIKIFRKDTRNYSRDFGVIIDVYTPGNQNNYKFPLEDEDLRKYMQTELQQEVLSAGDLMDKRNLKQLLNSRLIIYKPNSRHALQQVIFSKHGLGQRGERALTRGKKINGEMFVCKIFESGEEVSVQCYHRLTCKIFTCNITTKELHNWITDDYKIHQLKEVEEAKRTDKAENRPEPEILKPQNKAKYYHWILDHLVIDKRRGAFKVLFEIQKAKNRKADMIKKIQSIWRRALARPKVAKLLDQFMLKVNVSAFDPNFYYLNRKTGITTWEKPAILGSYDLPTQPERKWYSVTYEEDDTQYNYFVNPHSGLFSNYSIDQAVLILQKFFRRQLLKAISMPLAHFVKAGKIYNSAEKLYNENPNRLSSVINYAMVSHVINLEEDLAKDIYAEAVELSESNPLVTRAYAIYMIGVCEPPAALNRDRAEILIGDARRKDPENDKFRIAQYIFQFACIRQPRDYRTLINLALVQALIYDNNKNAEKLLRRAVGLAPFEERVMEIWKFLKDRFPESKMVYHAESRLQKVNTSDHHTKEIMVHGRTVKQNLQWAGWCYVEKDAYNVSKKFKDVSYWYNPADGTEQLDPPDFAEQWAIRKKRSFYQEEKGGLEIYFDPITSEYFQYHPLTDSYN